MRRFTYRNEKRRRDLTKRVRICIKFSHGQMLFVGTLCRHLFGEQNTFPESRSPFVITFLNITRFSILLGFKGSNILTLRICCSSQHPLFSCISSLTTIHGGYVYCILHLDDRKPRQRTRAVRGSVLLSFFAFLATSWRISQPVVGMT
jgi:hypothetical protein